MHNKRDQAAANAALRRAAEARLKGKRANPPPQTKADQQRLQHELEVHQIELEMQNEELRQSRAEIGAALERFSDSFDFAPVGYFYLTTDGAIQLVNLTGASLLGLGRAELKGQRLQVFVAEPDRPAFSNFFQRAFTTKTKQACDIALATKGRMPLHAHLEATLALDGVNCRIVMFDLTERKRAEAVLESRARLSEYALGHSLDELLTRTLDEAELLTGSTVGFFHFVEADQKTLSLQTGSTNTLRSICTAEGEAKQYSADKAGLWVDALRERRPMIRNDYASLPHRKGLPPGHAPVLRELVVPILRHKQVVALLGVGNKPGDYGPEDIESVSQLANLAWDIVLIKQAEEALKKSQRLLVETEKVGKVGGWELDIETGKQTWTEENYNIHEVDLSYEPTLEKGINFYTPASRPIIERAVKEAIERGEPFDLELEITTAKGNRRSVRAIGKADAKNRRIYGFFQDITERKQAAAEQEQLQAQNRLLRKSESLGRMAGAIAHNFNNQLQAVMMNLELALDNLSPDAGTGANLSEAMESARKAAAISTQMLTYLGQTHVQYEPLDLSEACRRGLPLFQGDLPEAVVLETDLPAPGPVISANASQIQQVLINLLTNACEASREGSGPIRLTVKLVSAASIPAVNRFPVDWQPHDPAYACLEVADSGCGIAAREIEELFDPFFSTKITGRGLGLAVVLGIVREHGGSITVESEPGRGSVFRVFLPVTAAAVPPRPLPVASAPKTAGHGTVLVVEDEPSVRTTITRALQRTGFTVIAAVDGVEAVELFGQHRDEICCVLCDLTMPRMGGWETLTALRKLAPGLPVILSSGYDEAKVMEGHHPELPQAYLRKPYELKALLNAISRVRPVGLG
jgi:PAS domain S-box-containing protein